GDVVEDRDRRRSPHQKAHELGTRSETARGVDRAIELAYGRDVRVQPKLDDRIERPRRRQLGGRNGAGGGDRERAIVQLPRRAKLSPRRRAGGAPRQQREGAPAKIHAASGIELVCKRERWLGVVRGD